VNDFEWHLLEDKPAIDHLFVDGAELHVGGKVRLRPRPGGDIMDLALAGKVGIIEAIEQNYEGEFHLAIVLEDDPGRDLGMMRQPGHRFFFTPEEVEALG